MISPYCWSKQGWSGAKLLPREVKPLIPPSSPWHTPKAQQAWGCSVANWSLGDPQPLGEAQLLALKAKLTDCYVSEFMGLSGRRGQTLLGLDARREDAATSLCPGERTQESGAQALALARHQATSALLASVFFLIK